MSTHPIAIDSKSAAPRVRASIYPPLFASRMAGREKRPLGEVFGLSNFGVNLCRLSPGAVSALRHAHSRQDEFVYVLQGSATLVSNAGRTTLTPDMCAGFKAGSGDAHCLVNESSEDVLYLEVGDRTPGDSAEYPDDDLQAVLISGQWQFTDKNGVPYAGDGGSR